MSNTPDSQGPAFPPPASTPPASPQTAVPPAAVSVPPPPPSGPYLPPTQPNYGQTQEAPTYLTDTAQPLQPAPPQTPRRSKGKVIGALAGVVVLLGAGTFAVAQISSNDDSGGAASPTEVGEKLVSAFDNEDILGAIDLLLPGERDTFRQPMIDLVSELSRLEVLDDSADLAKVGGLDISIDSSEVTVEETNVDDIANVSINATATVTVDGEQVPIGDLIIDRALDGERPDLDSEPADEDLDLQFASVREGERWYVSLFFTAAESARGDEDIPEQGVVPAGADTPEGAIDSMFTASADLDIEQMIALLNPNEAQALQRYAPLFLDDAQDALDEVGVDIQLSGGEYEVTGDGDTRQVAVRALTVEAVVDEQRVTVELRDGCVIATVDETEMNSCDAIQGTDEAIDDYLTDLGLEDTTAINTLIDDATEAFSDYSMHGIVVDNVDGKWYVSPIGTYSELVLSVLRALDRDEIETLLDDGMAAIESFENNDIEIIDDGANSDDSSTEDSDEFSWYACLNEGSSEAAAECIRTGVAAGTYDPASIPAPYLYPDCGLFDYYNSNELYTDTAADFNATIAPGAQCIVDAAAADGLDLQYLTPEFSHPQCFTDVNPYDYTTNDADYSAAFDCVYEAG